MTSGVTETVAFVHALSLHSTFDLGSAYHDDLPCGLNPGWYPLVPGLRIRPVVTTDSRTASTSPWQVDDN